MIVRHLRKALTALVILLVLAGVTFKVSKMTSMTEPSLIRFSFPYKRSSQSYEPTNITLAPEYTFLEHVFSPLVEFNPQGQLVGGVAEQFAWVGNDAVFTIRSNLKTIDGLPITAADAAESIKRVILRSSNTHGNIKDLLCGPDEEICSRIQVRGHQLVLKLSRKHPFLFPMLASIDFAIVPRSSMKAGTQEIVDYRNTSGSYYVDSDDGVGNISLKANPNHYHYSPHLPQVIQLVPLKTSDPMEPLRELRAGNVDFVSTDTAREEDILKMNAEAPPGFEYHHTLGIRTYCVVFTLKGLKKWPIAKRIAIGKLFRQVLRPYFLAQSPQFESVDQLFPAFGEGGIAAQQRLELEQIFSAHTESLEPTQGITVGTLRIGSAATYEGLLKPLIPGIKFQELTSVPDQGLQAPDLYIAGPDTGFMEDIGLISHYLSVRLLGLDQRESEKWLQEYSAIDEKASRIQRLQQLHFETLKNGRVIPLVSGPYSSVVRSPWKMGLSKIYSNNQLWLLKRP